MITRHMFHNVKLVRNRIDIQRQSGYCMSTWYDHHMVTNVAFYNAF